MALTDELLGERVVVRAATIDDRDRLLAIRLSPPVALWWDFPRDDDWPLSKPDVQRCAVTLNGDPIGFVQWYENGDPEYRHGGIDVFLDAAHHGQGLGRDTVCTVLRYLIEVEGHHRVVIDPAADNTAAIACYRACGFRDVGVMRFYERHQASGVWHDGLLMEYVIDPTKPRAATRP